MRTKLEDFGDVLSAVQSVDSFAHIAGGAVRDTYCEKPIRDIDLFLPAPNCDVAAEVLRFKLGYVMVGKWVQYEGFSDPFVEQVAKFDKADETIPVCLIGLRDDVRNIRQNLSRFDFGACMAAWDGTSRIIQMEAFKEDMSRKEFTLLRADNANQYAYSMARYKKLTAVGARYEGWKLAVSVEFEDLVKAAAFREHWYHDWTDLEECSHSPQLLRPKER
jgi:hypothetical protein